jgi:hypothetical protein
MPKAEIMSANDSREPVKYTPPHERKNGPWDEYDLEDGGRTMERAEEIRGNPKYVEAIAKHHEKKAKHHRKLAEGMKSHMKRGLVSERALEKAAKSNHA